MANVVTLLYTYSRTTFTNLEKGLEDADECIRLLGEMDRQPFSALHLLGHVVRDHDRDRLEAIAGYRRISLLAHRPMADRGSGIRGEKTSFISSEIRRIDRMQKKTKHE